MRLFFNVFKFVFFLMIGLVLCIAFYTPRPDISEESHLLVVLGAGYTRDGEPVLALEKRLDKTLSLWDKGKKIVVSGREEEVYVMEEYLLHKGTPYNSIIRDIYGENTRSTVKNAFIISEELDTVPTFISQAYHLPRIRIYSYIYGKNINSNFVPTDRVKMPLDKLLFVSLREVGAIMAFSYLYFKEI